MYSSYLLLLCYFLVNKNESQERKCECAISCLFFLLPLVSRGRRRQTGLLCFSPSLQVCTMFGQKNNVLAEISHQMKMMIELNSSGYQKTLEDHETGQTSKAKLLQPNRRVCCPTFLVNVGTKKKKKTALGRLVFVFSYFA